jgi:PAS domain S-box-containing protein
LRDTRDRLQAVLDSALDVAILVVSLRGKVELFSRGAERMFGYGQHEVIGRSTLMFHDPAELQARADARTAELGRPVGKSEMMMLLLDAGGQSSLSHWTFVRKSGERLNAALRFSRMTDPDGRVLGFLAVVLDVSAQVQAQQALQTLNTELERRVTERTQELAQAHEELVRSDKLAALGSMVAGVSHELNTPIGTSLTVASTLSDRCQELRNALSSNTVRRSTLEAFLQDTQALGDLLQRSLLNAADLVQHFKQLSADQTSEQRRSFRLDQVVEDVVTVTRPQLKQGGLRLHTDIEPDLWMDSYPGALGRVLTNLLINAQLHAFEGREGGQVHIRAKRLPGQEAVQLLVADDGQGMSAEVARRAFDPFFTTKLGRGGTGLGLNIVHNVATVILGGSLHLDTAPGQGTCFVFELPLSAPNDTSPGDNLTGYRASGWDPLKRTNGAR